MSGVTLNAGPAYLSASRGMQDEGIIRESTPSRLVRIIAGGGKKSPTGAGLVTLGGKSNGLRLETDPTSQNKARHALTLVKLGQRKAPPERRAGAALGAGLLDPHKALLCPPGDPCGAARAGRAKGRKRDRLYRRLTRSENCQRRRPSYAVSPAGHRQLCALLRHRHSA